MMASTIFTGLEKLIKGKKGSREEVPVSSLDGEGKVIGLYFSANWCSPCRAFTPNLVKWYTELKNGPLSAKFDIVYLSWDREEEAFDEYFDKMPWLALPFNEKELPKKTICKKYKVTGIPTFLLLDAKTGKLLNKSAHEVVLSDQKGEQFPWQEPTLQERLSSVEFINKEGEKKPFSEISGKPFGLYFSAHWCPPCRSFTPKLVEFYEKLKGKLEIIFISSDKDESQFKEYLDKMPWVAVPYSSGNDMRGKLNELYEVEGIPHLVIFDENCKMATDCGRDMVESDPEGKDFPWGPKALDSLHAGTVCAINERPCVVYITADGSEAEVKKAKDLLEPVAKPYFEENKEKEDSIRFLYTVTEDELCGTLMQFLNIPEPFPKMIIIDIPNQKKYIYPDTSEENGPVDVGGFVKKFQDCSLTSKGLKE